MTNNEEAVHHAVSFAAANTFIGLPQMKAYTSINIRFQIRTFESNGLLMYNAGKFVFSRLDFQTEKTRILIKFYESIILHFNTFTGKASDFIAVELIRGKIHYILNLGYGPINIRDTSIVNVSDNKWHEVSIGRPSRYRHTLMVDGHITEQNTQGDNYHLDLDGILFLGNFSS